MAKGMDPLGDLPSSSDSDSDDDDVEGGAGAAKPVGPAPAPRKEVDYEALQKAGYSGCVILTLWRRSFAASSGATPPLRGRRISRHTCASTCLTIGAASRRPFIHVSRLARRPKGRPRKGDEEPSCFLLPPPLLCHAERSSCDAPPPSRIKRWTHGRPTFERMLMHASITFGPHSPSSVDGALTVVVQKLVAEHT